MDNSGNYAIAYEDENGNGFSNSEPWILLACGKDVESCKKRAAELVKSGFKTAIPFMFGSELLESYSWDYVKSHRI